MTRSGCLLGVVGWLLIMTLPLCALVFAARGEFSWQRGAFVEDRLWLVNQPDSPGQEGASGLAYSATRVASREASEAGPERVCVRTNVVFFLWRGQSEALNFCECYLASPGAINDYELLGECT